jgi:hypothetical protein
MGRVLSRYASSARSLAEIGDSSHNKTERPPYWAGTASVFRHHNIRNKPCSCQVNVPAGHFAPSDLIICPYFPPQSGQCHIGTLPLPNPTMCFRGCSQGGGRGLGFTCRAPSHISRDIRSSTQKASVQIFRDSSRCTQKRSRQALLLIVEGCRGASPACGYIHRGRQCVCSLSHLNIVLINEGAVCCVPVVTTHTNQSSLGTGGPPIAINFLPLKPPVASSSKHPVVAHDFTLQLSVGINHSRSHTSQEVCPCVPYTAFVESGFAGERVLPSCAKSHSPFIWQSNIVYLLCPHRGHFAPEFWFIVHPPDRFHTFSRLPASHPSGRRAYHTDTTQFRIDWAGSLGL